MDNKPEDTNVDESKVVENGVEMEVIEDGELLRWNQVGTKVVGVLRSYTPRKDTGKGPGHVYEVQTKEGIVPFFAPSLLHKKLKNIAIGNIVSIKYTQESKTGVGNTLKHFEVGTAKPTEGNLKSLGLDSMFDEVDAEEDF